MRRRTRLPARASRATARLPGETHAPEGNHHPGPRTARPASLARLCRVDQAQEVRGIVLSRHDRGKARRLVVAIRELQDAAAVPDEVVAVVLQGAEVLQGVQEGGPRDLRVDRVAEVGDGADEADCRAGPLFARVDEIDVPAPAREPLGAERAGKPGADDDGATLRSPGGGGLAVTPPGEYFALVAESGALLDAEARSAEGRAHAAGDGPGRERRSGRGQPRQFAHHFRRPHLGVAGGREAVEVERVGAGFELRQEFARVAGQERELHAPAVELQAMEAGEQRRPHGQQRVGQRPQFLEGSQGLRQVSGREGMAFDGNEMQARRSGAIGAPGIPGGEEVEAQPEARLEDREGVAIAPAFGQGISGEEDAPCLGKAACDGVIGVLVLRRVRHAVGSSLEPRGRDADGADGHAGMIPPGPPGPARRQYSAAERRRL